MARKTTEEEVQNWIKNKRIYTMKVDYPSYHLYQSYIKETNYNGDIYAEAAKDYPDAQAITIFCQSIRIKT